MIGPSRDPNPRKASETLITVTALSGNSLNITKNTDTIALRAPNPMINLQIILYTKNARSSALNRNLKITRYNCCYLYESLMLAVI